MKKKIRCLVDNPEKERLQRVLGPDEGKMTGWKDSCKSTLREQVMNKSTVRKSGGGGVRDRWRITETEAGRLLTGREMKRQLHCSKEPIRV